MKKLIYILIVFCFACSTSDDGDNGNTSSTFSVTLTANDTAVIDEVIQITVSTNETMKSLKISIDNFTTSLTHYSDLGTTALRYSCYDKLGVHTVYFKVTNNNDEELIKTIDITIIRGNAVKLQSLKLNSFYNIGETWDPEYSDTDSNRFADVFFAILKPRLNVIDGTRGTIPTGSWLWYRSETRNNESNLNWNIQNEELFINIEELTPYIAFVDDDGNGNLAGDLMLGPPFERVIPLADYLSTQPNTILVEETDINLEYELSVDW